MPQGAEDGQGGVLRRWHHSPSIWWHLAAWHLKGLLSLEFVLLPRIINSSRDNSTGQAEPYS